jgi:hypothetical protein
MIVDSVPRPMNRQEEAELLKAANRAAAAKERYEELLAERNRLIADLMAGEVRATAIADLLKMTPRAVRDAQNRARGR